MRTPTRHLTRLVATMGMALALAGAVVAAPAASSTAPSADPTTFRPFQQPRPQYLSSTCTTGLSTVPDGTSVDLLVNQCGFEIELSPAAVKESVPVTWKRWGHPPQVERVHPDVLYTDGATSLTLSWPFDQNRIGGVEVEPRDLGPATFRADYYSGPDGTGTLVGRIERDASAPGGARLLGARSTVPWQSIVITSTSGEDFAIANIRSS